MRGLQWFRMQDGGGTKIERMAARN